MGKHENLVNNIVSIFNNDNIGLIDLDIDNKWKRPDKDTSHIKSKIQYADIISNNILKKNEDNSYDTSYLNDVFEKIDHALCDSIPIELFRENKGYVFPSSEHDKKLFNYKQLYNLQSCNRFISKVCDFGGFPKNGTDGLEYTYLLGYVGSGKTTFLNYFLSTKKEYFKKNNIISIFFQYDEINKELYDATHESSYWQHRIETIILKKIIKSPEFIEPKELWVKVRNIINTNNIIICIDGFDSLSANQIERKNVKLVLSSIRKVMINLSEIYKLQHTVDFGCQIIFSLRKCTYDSLDVSENIGRIDSDDAFFLHAPAFEDIIEQTISTLSHDNHFMEKNSKVIFEIISLVSQSIDSSLWGEGCEIHNHLDTFDNNYRRRLRYIFSLIIVHALKLSNKFTPSKRSKDINHDFLLELQYSFQNKNNRNTYIDILVHGLNTGFNNHFSNNEAEDNLGRLCGFVDNIFNF